MKLELKYIVEYLPYALKFEMQNDSHEDFDHLDFDEDLSEDLFKSGSIWELCGYSSVEIPVRHDGEILGMIFKKECGTLIGDNGSLKPILRPLSDLLKKDLVEHLDLKECREGWVKFYSDDPWGNNIPYRVYLGLIKHHFDVFGLIDKGLAIDINKLKQS